MADPAPPPPGSMFLYDAMLPPLEAGRFRMVVEQDVERSGTDLPLTGQTSYFDLECPRFTLPATEVAGVFPPRNGQGPFERELPHIVLGRRTLPWERELDPGNHIGAPAPVDPPDRDADPPSHPGGRPPWLALLLFDEGEYDIVRNERLDRIVPGEVLSRLGAPADTSCDAVEADLAKIKAIMPSKEELQLLAHVRQVNVDDRELAAGDSDGWFAVVVSNRLPAAGKVCCACLVSVEERDDLVAADPPEFTFDRRPPRPTHERGPHTRVLRTDGDAVVGLRTGREEEAIEAVELAEQPARDVSASSAALVRAAAPGASLSTAEGPGDRIVVAPKPPERARLVLLHSWRFTCEGQGSFRELTQHVDSALIGTGHPDVADTGHIPLTLQDRAGAPEQVWYRGPCVPHKLSRDTIGPYHSADQARRVSPETGAEDVSYAAAFELGRLLAISNGRFSQELMRWRREAYREASRADVIAAVEPLVEQVREDIRDRIHEMLGGALAATVLQELADGAGPLADPWLIDTATLAPGCDPQILTEVWALPSLDAAEHILAGEASLGTSIGEVELPQAGGPATLDELEQSPDLGQLDDARGRVIEGVDRTLGGGG